MPKIIILLCSMGCGGSERVVSLLLAELAKTHQVTLVLLEKRIFYPIPKAVNVVILGQNSQFESPWKKALKLPYLAYCYAKLIKDKPLSVSFLLRPNCINILAKLFAPKTKILIAERGHPSRQYGANTLACFVCRQLIGRLYKRADKICANTTLSLEELQIVFGIPKPKLTLLPNLFDIANLQKKASKPSPNKAFLEQKRQQGYLLFASIGRLDAGKNHALLLHAFKRANFKRAHVFLIGDGELRSSLQELVFNLGLEERVSFFGELENPHALLDLAHCLVLSSDYEGFANVIVESFGLGVPVIATCIQEELLGNQITFYRGLKCGDFGIGVGVGDEEALCLALRYFAQNQYQFKPHLIKEHALKWDKKEHIQAYYDWLK